MSLKRIKKNNSGMTLVELLVAMAIFAAAIVPMLYAFVFSTGYNFRAQQTMQSTGIAQAIFERAKAPGYVAENIRAQLQNGTFITSYDPNNAATQPFTYSGVSGGTGPEWWFYDVKATRTNGEAVDQGNADRRSYDVKVYYNSIDGSTYDVSAIQSMSHDSTANFADGYFDNLLGEDDIAQGELVSLIESEVMVDGNVKGAPPGVTLPAGISNEFSAADILLERAIIDRVITITASDTGVTAEVKYYCSEVTDGDGKIRTSSKNVVIGGHTYSLHIEGSLDSSHAMGGSSPVYTADIDGTGAGFVQLLSDKATAVYFYYYPRYSSTGSYIPGYQDHFILKNDMTSSGVKNDGTTETGRLNFYLFKQYNSSWDTPAESTAYSNREKAYCPTVEMTDAAFPTYLYDNFLLHVKDGSSLQGCPGSIAESSLSISTNISTGINCHNSTKYVTSIGTMDYKYILRDSAPIAPPQYRSLLLEDNATMPYLHEEGMAYSANMFPSRYSMFVEVYKDKDDASTLIEKIEGEVLGW